MNLATIGTSWITSRLIDAAFHSGKLTLHSVYSRSEEKAQEFGRMHDAVHTYNNLDEMLKNKEIDIVYVSSPNSLHFEQTMKCLQAKKHVICEKPIFSNIKELNTAYSCAQKNNVFLFEAIRNIHTPNFHLLVKQLHKVGQIRSVSLNYLQYSSKYDAFLSGDEPNVFSPNFSGGALVDLGVYPLFIAVALFGKPFEIHYYPVKLRNGIDGNGTLILKYGDFICTIICSKISDSYLASEIHGEEGTIILDKASTFNHMVWRENKDKSSVVFSVQQEENDMVYELDHFVDIIHLNNTIEYERLKNLSYIVLEITEEARKQNNILFAAEK
ncbi:Gfo/Idh/MocA family oxidoreductase [Bacillus sp. FJAT-49736]|uniref:Gfo/Idh/MocA family protein n=1 Tax=Bacillus sp. FJAT-49736 TaxID=2833582 RepID=UPI001BCA5560|nr:Gfo/Idh/MocA family oxidoreductase [Bacillus sp. FJAT-49736]MBS4172279.1 Gfo/Idh/MocA family oxidoreductase [Bacillus sp. FJAT-49736]